MFVALSKAQRTANAVRLLRTLVPAKRRRAQPKKRWPVREESDYARDLRVLTVQALAPALVDVLGALPAMIASARASKRLDAVAMRVDAGEAKRLMDQAYAQIMSRLQVRDVAALANRYGHRVSVHNRKELGRVLDATLGVAVTVPDGNATRTIDAFIDQNVSVVLDNVERFCGNVEKDITRMLASSRLDAASRVDARRDPIARAAIANARLIVNRPDDFDAKRVAEAVRRNVDIGGSNRQLAEELSRRFDFARDHAEAIARDQVGKLNGQIDAQRQQQLGVSRFIWRTVSDERVRDEHAERDGETYEYDDPPDGDLPGEPINCRCSAEPVLEDIFAELDV